MKWAFRVLVGLVLIDGLSVILRPLHDRLGSKRCDLDHVLPGDELLPHGDAVITRAITIDAPASAIWPWLLQLGWGRAGWYAIDLIDNGGRPSADRILPEHQALAVGDTVPSGPFGIGFKVVDVEPERYLLLGSQMTGGESVWLFYLEPVSAGRTRLIERLRGRTEWWSPLRWLSGPADLLDLIMMRKHLRGVRDRAERYHAAGGS